MHFTKSQGAMEYLLSYGWAIIVIAVVVAALFELGVFNNTQQNLAHPGQCQVLRTNGPGTLPAELSGLCTGLWPFAVAQYNTATREYANHVATGGVITVANNYGLLTTGNSMTVSMWILPSLVQPTTDPVLISQGLGVGCAVPPPAFCTAPGKKPVFWQFNTTNVTVNGAFNGLSFSFNDSGGVLESFNSVGAISSKNFTFLTLTLSYNVITFYVNGAKVSQYTSQNTIQQITNQVDIGAQGVDGGAGNGQLNFFSGFISNVQMYSTALNSNDVKQLYLEGIGGAPIDTSHLYLWLMLNQNANDTSGNQGYGIANSNTVFVTNWWTGGRYNGAP